jgi:hypothetical protein
MRVELDDQSTRRLLALRRTWWAFWCTKPVDVEGLRVGLSWGGIDPHRGDPAESVVPIEARFAMDVADDFA